MNMSYYTDSTLLQTMNGESLGKEGTESWSGMVGSESKAKIEAIFP